MTCSIEHIPDFASSNQACSHLLVALIEDCCILPNTSCIAGGQKSSAAITATRGRIAAASFTACDPMIDLYRASLNDLLLNPSCC